MKLLDSVKSMSTATYGETTRLRVYRTNLSLNWKVLDFVKRGGPVIARSGAGSSCADRADAARGRCPLPEEDLHLPVG